MKKIRTGICLLIFLLLLSGTVVQAAKQNSEKSRKKYLILYDTNGKVYKRYRLNGKKIRLPAMRARGKATFLGWSKTKKRFVNPEYEAGMYIKSRNTMHLYAVKYPWKNEKDVSAEKLRLPVPEAYRKVVFVGDSRTVYMKRAVEEAAGAVPDGISFVAKANEGLIWFDLYGSVQLEEVLADEDMEKPAAVIINLGVNDLKYTRPEFVSCDQTIQNYLIYMKHLAERLQKYNCRLFYMSVNPVNSANLAQPGSRHEEDIRRFNEAIRKALGDTYTYIDAYSYLMKKGLRMDGWGRGKNYDDGLHYSARTFRRIYRYCMRKIG